MLIKRIFIFALMGFSSLASAEFCKGVPYNDSGAKTVDLRYEMGPLRDQDSIGWCYGFTAADLLTHYLYKTKAREVIRPDRKADYRGRDYAVSAVGMSVIFNSEKNADYYKNIGVVRNSKELAQKYKKSVVAESGNINDALMAAKENGFCFEKNLPSENFGFVLDSRCAAKGACNLKEMLENVFDSANKCKTCVPNMALQKFFPTLNERMISSVLSISERTSAIDRLVGVACQKRFEKHLISDNEPVIKYATLNDPSSKTFQKGFKINTPNDLMNQLDANLDRGTPVGIAYFADFLVKENAGHGSPHASSIVGKRFNPSTCEVEYILRNSWGSHCDIYNKENPQYSTCVSSTNTDTNPKIIYEKMRKCRNLFPPIPRNPRVTCEPMTGHAYVRKSDLMKNLYSLSYIVE